MCNERRQKIAKCLNPAVRRTASEYKLNAWEKVADLYFAKPQA